MEWGISYENSRATGREPDGSIVSYTRFLRAGAAVGAACGLPRQPTLQARRTQHHTTHVPVALRQQSTFSSVVVSRRLMTPMLRNVFCDTVSPAHLLS